MMQVFESQGIRFRDVLIDSSLPADGAITRKPGIGLVLERKRLPHEDDALMWFCVNCNHKLYEEFFHLVDIEHDFFRVFERFYRDDALRTCSECGTLNPRPQRYEMDAQSQADTT